MLYFGLMIQSDHGARILKIIFWDKIGLLDPFRFTVVAGLGRDF